MPVFTSPYAADKAWYALIISAVVFEFASDDKLSESTERFVHRHPVLTRVVIFAVAGHLACTMPAMIDVFNAKNVLHRACVHGSRGVKTRWLRPAMQAA